MKNHPKLTSTVITALSEASNCVKVAVAESKANGSLLGSMRTLPWEQAFTLAVLGSIVREVPGSTYTTKRFVFDSAQRISNAWYFEPSSIDRTLNALERKRLVEWRQNGLQADLTAKAKKMLLAASKALEASDES